MSTWAGPDTLAKMETLERAMETPIPARDFSSRLGTMVADDELHDLIRRAEDKDGAADIRPIIAAQLELWTRWQPATPGQAHREPGLRERARFLAENHLGEGLHDLVRQPALEDTGVAAALKVTVDSDRLDRDTTEYHVHKIATGLYAVHERASDEMYRVDCLTGTVLQCPEAMVRDIVDAYFDPAPPAPVN